MRDSEILEICVNWRKIPRAATGTFHLTFWLNERFIAVEQTA